MIPAVTVIERLVAFSSASVAAAIIFAVATMLHRAISKHDPVKRIQGEPIRYWVTACYLLGAGWGAVIANNVNYVMHEVVGGMGGFGILVGWAIGMVHGFARMFYHPSPQLEIALLLKSV